MKRPRAWWLGLFRVDDASRASRLSHEFLIYLTGAGINLLASFALLGLYGRFAPADLGLLTTAQVFGVLVIQLSRLGLHVGMFRDLASSNYRESPGSATSIVSTCFWFGLGCALPVALIVWLVAQSPDVARMDARWPSILEMIALTVAISLPRETSETLFRATRRAGSYLVVSGSFSVLATLLTFWFVLFQGWGIGGVFAAGLIANVVVVVPTVAFIRELIRPSEFSLGRLRSVLRFGLPSVGAGVGDWLLQYSDRIFLATLAGMGQVGIYSLGYRIGLIQHQVLGTATDSAWHPLALNRADPRSTAPELAKVATYFILVGMVLAVALAAGTPVLLGVLSVRSEYLSVTVVVFLVALANLFGTARLLFLTPTSVAARPAWGVTTWMFAIVANLLLNVILIPIYGMYGAAWATLLAFMSSAAVAQFGARTLWAIPFEWARLLKILIAGCLAYACSWFAVTIWNVVPSVLFVPMALSLFAVVLVCLGFPSKAETALLTRRLRQVHWDRQSGG